MKWENNNMNESGKTMNGSKSNVNGGVSDNGSVRRRLNRLMMRYTTPRLELTNRIRCNKQ